MNDNNWNDGMDQIHLIGTSEFVEYLMDKEGIDEIDQEYVKEGKLLEKEALIDEDRENFIEELAKHIKPLPYTSVQPTSVRKAQKTIRKRNLVDDVVRAAQDKAFATVTKTDDRNIPKAGKLAKKLAYDETVLEDEFIDDSIELTF